MGATQTVSWTQSTPLSPQPSQEGGINPTFCRLRNRHSFQSIVLGDTGSEFSGRGRTRTRACLALKPLPRHWPDPVLAPDEGMGVTCPGGRGAGAGLQTRLMLAVLWTSSGPCSRAGFSQKVTAESTSHRS